MKKTLLSMFIMFFMGIIAISAQAVITFETTTHNFGTFKEDSIQKKVFVFKNTGNQPLLIEGVTTSCGCTASNYTKEPIKPSKTGVIEVTYNGKGKMSGHFKKVITVNTNAAEKVVRLFIEGDMEGKQ